MSTTSSSIDKLPPDLRDWLDKAIVTHPFAGYEAIATALRDKGYQVSRSSVHRYAKAAKAQLTHKASSETARALCIVAAAIKGADDVEGTAQRYLSWVQHG